MRQTVLIVLWVLCGSSPAAMAVAAPYGSLELTSAERALIDEHLGKRLPYHVSINRSTEFPEVLRIVRYIDDVGPTTDAMIVDEAWIDWGGFGAPWAPEEATRRVLEKRGWSMLDEGKRRALALRWVIDSLSPGFSSQTAADGGHPPEVTVEGGEVIVRIWLIARFTSIAGPRVTYDHAARVLRFKPDGSTAEGEPATGHHRAAARHQPTVPGMGTYRPAAQGSDSR